VKTKISKLYTILTSKNNDLETDKGRSHERIRRIGLTAVAATVNRAVTVLSSLLTVPITLKYLGVEQFGLWMTLTGFVAFLAFSDLGLGIGLQNSLTECHGKDDKITPSQLITTALALLTLIGIALCLVAWFAMPQLPLNDLLNVTTEEAVKNLLPTAQAVIIVFGLSLPLGIIQRILDAYQEGFLSNVLQTIGRVLAFVSIFVCIHLHYPLPIMAALYMGLPFLFLALSSLFIFWKRPWLRPNIWSFKVKMVRKISGIGAYALLAQLGASIMSTGPLLLLSSQFGAGAIVPFAITQRLLGVLGMVISLALGPLWPAYGEAKVRGDINWIKLTFKRSIKVTLWIALPAFIAISVLGLPIIELWTSNEKSIPTWSLLMACNVWMLFLSVIRLYSMLLNGLGYFKGQAIYGVILPILALIAGYYLSKDFGLTSVIWSIVLSGEVVRSLFMTVDAKRALTKLDRLKY
jgi:O-antigen/teichoic acid export membrane protein